MSTTAHIVYGVCIPREKFNIMIYDRGCNHETRDFPFCPECGKPMWVGKINGDFDSFDTHVLSYFYSSVSSEYIILGFEIDYCESNDAKVINKMSDDDEQYYKTEIVKVLKQYNIDVPHVFETYIVCY